MVDKLELKNIEFSYKNNKNVLKKLNSRFNGGEITALLGINGCGKTTLFKILTGIYQTTGSIFYNNLKITGKNITKFKSKIGFMPEFLQLYPNMKVCKLLELLGDLKGYKNFNLKEVLETVFLLEHAEKKVKALSKGMKQRLNLAQAIIGNPKIILFDEPSNGFDCGSINMFYKILKSIVKNGAIALISSHHLTEIYGNVDKVLILSNGRIIKEIIINDSKNNENFLYKEIYISFEESIEYRKINLMPDIAKSITIRDNLIYGRVNNKMIVNLLSNLISLNFKISDIRIENKILEDVLINLS